LSEFGSRSMAGVLESRVGSVAEGLVVAAWEQGRSAKWVMREAGLTEAQVHRYLDDYLQKFRRVGDEAHRAKVVRDFLGDADPGLVANRRMMEQFLSTEFQNQGVAPHVAATKARLHAAQSATALEAVVQEAFLSGRGGRALMQRFAILPEQIRGWLETYLRSIRNIDDAAKRAKLINDFIGS